MNVPGGPVPVPSKAQQRMAVEYFKKHPEMTREAFVLDLVCR